MGSQRARCATLSSPTQPSPLTSKACCRATGHTGESRYPEIKSASLPLDSGFRRNDGRWAVMRLRRDLVGDMIDHRLGDLVLAHDHEVRAMFLEMLDLGLGMAPRDDGQHR